MTKLFISAFAAVCAAGAPSESCLCLWGFVRRFLFVNSHHSLLSWPPFLSFTDLVPRSSCDSLSGGLLRASYWNVIEQSPDPPLKCGRLRPHLTVAYGEIQAFGAVPSVAAHRIALLLALVSPDIRPWNCTASTASALLLIMRGGTILVFSCCKRCRYLFRPRRSSFALLRFLQ